MSKSTTLVTVFPDEFIEAQKKDAGKSEEETPDSVFSSAKLKKLFDSVGPYAFTALVPGGFVTKTAVAILGAATKEAVEAWVRAKNQGLPVKYYSFSEADELSFPPGHPNQKVLYASHPADNNIYYTAASFHRKTFEHKFSEAIRLLMHLGAETIDVSHEKGWASEFSSNLSVGIPTAGEVGGEIGLKQTASEKLLYKASFKNLVEPALPSDLIWYPHEPTWKMVAEGRLDFGLSDFSLSISYEEDFGINAGVKLKAEKAGLDLGGSFEDHQATVWKVSGSFREIP